MCFPSASPNNPHARRVLLSQTITDIIAVGAEDDPIDLISSDDGSPAPPPVTSSARLRKERAYIPNITDDSGSASEVNLLRNLLPGVQAAKERAAKQAAQEASKYACCPCVTPSSISARVCAGSMLIGSR